jgi:hypothetical protein
VPLLVLALALLAILALFVLLLPLSLVQRYRLGKARRLARGWVVTTNLISLALSAAVFLAGAAITSVWVPRALLYSVLGLLAGCLLGLLGLAASRWEPGPAGLHYTPNRWLVLALTLLVSGRLAYGFWRGWQAWRQDPGDAGWLAAIGVAGSMAAGAVVLGYYLAYWAGLRRLLGRQRRGGRSVRPVRST